MKSALFVVYRSEAVSFGREYSQKGFVVARGLKQTIAKKQCKDLNDKRTPGQIRRGVRFGIRREEEAKDMKNLSEVNNSLSSWK